MPIQFENASNSHGKMEDTEISVQMTTVNELLLDDSSANSREEFVKECLLSNSDNYFEKINKLQVYLDMVSEIVKPGCSPELLTVALDYMSSVVGTLSMMSSRQYPRSSL